MKVDESLLSKHLFIVLILSEHKETESEINGCYEVIKCFVERMEKALLIAKNKKFKLIGTLRNVQKEYAIVFTATGQGGIDTI